MALASIQGMGQTITDDPRTETQMLRRFDLVKIAKARGINFKGYPTSEQLLKLLEAEGIEANFRVLLEAEAGRDDTALRTGLHNWQITQAAEMEAFKEVVAKAPWFGLKKLADEYDVDIDAVAPKGTKDRSAVLREAILKAALDG